MRSRGPFTPHLYYLRGAQRRFSREILWQHDCSSVNHHRMRFQQEGPWHHLYYHREAHEQLFREILLQQPEQMAFQETDVFSSSGQMCSSVPLFYLYPSYSVFDLQQITFSFKRGECMDNASTIEKEIEEKPGVRSGKECSMKRVAAW